MGLAPAERARRREDGRTFGVACALADADQGAQARDMLADRPDLLDRLDQRARQRSDDQLRAAASAAIASGHTEHGHGLLADRPDLLAAVPAERDQRDREDAAKRVRHDAWVSRYGPVIRAVFPGCPSSAVNDIGWVHGHPNVTPENMERMLRAHVRHQRTMYDDVLTASRYRRKDSRYQVVDKDAARRSVRPIVDGILNEWKVVR